MPILAEGKIAELIDREQLAREVTEAIGRAFVEKLLGKEKNNAKPEG